MRALKSKIQKLFSSSQNTEDIETTATTIKRKNVIDFEFTQRIFPCDIILFENSSNSKFDIEEFKFKLNLLIDFNQVEYCTPEDLLQILESSHCGRILCCVATTKFFIFACPFPIFHVGDSNVFLDIANLFKRTVTHIYFYNKNEPYYALSNFFELPDEIFYCIEGEFYRSVEHYFQSKKFLKSSHILQILQSNSAREAFQVARSLNNFKTSTWDQEKLTIMKQGLIGKFLEEELKYLLFFTGAAIIYEHTEIDNFWADGGFEINGNGLNVLGKLLMEIRDSIAMEVGPQELDNFYSQSLFFACWQNSKRRVIGPPNAILELKRQKMQIRIEALYSRLNSV